MMPDAIQLQDERGRTARNLDGSYGRPDVEGLLDAIAARMSGETPGARPGAAQGRAQARPESADDDQNGLDASGFDPGFGLDGLHADDLLELARSMPGQGGSPGTNRAVAVRLLQEMMRQDPNMLARMTGRQTGPGSMMAGPATAGAAGQAGAMLARRLAGSDPLFDRVVALMQRQIGSLPAFYRNFVRSHLGSDPDAFASVYAETRRKYLAAKATSGKASRRAAPVLERSGAGDPPMTEDLKQAKIKALTRKIKSNRGSAKDFGEILDLSGVLDRMCR